MTHAEALSTLSAIHALLDKTERSDRRAMLDDARNPIAVVTVNAVALAAEIARMGLAIAALSAPEAPPEAVHAPSGDSA